jgi:DNA-binding NarL/FixJ family response regulator
MREIKYIIADDHKIFRQGLKFALSEDEQLKCIGEAEDGVELMTLLKSVRADVILLDLKMPKMDGIDAAKEIRQKHPYLKIITLTMHEDDNFILHMLDIGVNGYLAKSTDAHEIIAAIHEVYDNQYYFNDMVSKAMLKNLVEKNKIKPKFKDGIDLSDKEREVLRLICEEHTNVEIAEKIYLSARTVEGIRSTLLEKIGVRNTVGLVLYAVKNGIV